MSCRWLIQVLTRSKHYRLSFLCFLADKSSTPYSHYVSPYDSVRQLILDDLDRIDLNATSLLNWKNVSGILSYQTNIQLSYTYPTVTLSLALLHHTIYLLDYINDLCSPSAAMSLSTHTNNHSQKSTTITLSAAKSVAGKTQNIHKDPLTGRPSQSTPSPSPRRPGILTTLYSLSLSSCQSNRKPQKTHSKSPKHQKEPIIPLTKTIPIQSLNSTNTAKSSL